MAMRSIVTIVALVMLAAFAAPSGASAALPAIPPSVWETCSRYPTIEVNASGTTVTFAAKDDPQKLCAVVVAPSPNTDSPLFAALANLKLVFARWGCWEVTAEHRSGPAIVMRCDSGGSFKEFSVTYQNGILFGFNISW